MVLKFPPPFTFIRKIPLFQIILGTCSGAPPTPCDDADLNSSSAAALPHSCSSIQISRAIPFLVPNLTSNTPVRHSSPHCRLSSNPPPEQEHLLLLTLKLTSACCINAFPHMYCSIHPPAPSTLSPSAALHSC